VGWLFTFAFSKILLIMKKRKPKVAILISTYDWPEALELVLLSILQQTQMPDEVLIADDGSKQDTQLLIERYRRKFSIPLKHAWHEDKGFRKCLILNKAIKLSEADYIIEIDGDIIINPRFVADHMKAAQKGVFVQGSRTMLTEERSKEILQTKEISFHSLSRGVYSRFNAVRIPILSVLFRPDPRSSYNVKGCNLAFWRDDYIKINGYYNGFEGWGWEDFEFGQRLINAGILKKRLKMAAISYHIFHKINSRENFLPNELIYRETLDNKLTYRDNGYREA